MTGKIYEYKDKENWFLGEWGGFNAISGLGNVCGDDLYELSQKVAKLVAKNAVAIAMVTVIKMILTATMLRLLKNRLIFS